jgi:3-isopropylmalate/(R)-2-methylmalate dehydratase large subunit
MKNRAELKTLIDRIWESHVVVQDPDCPAVLYIDLHLCHEATSAQAFTELRARGQKVRRPDRTLATVDHLIPTHDRSLPIRDPQAVEMISHIEKAAKEFGVPLYSTSSDRQGIVHVIGPELGLSQPGMTIVCGDSHTSTHGAMGALAFGIGTTEVGHVLATQCLLQRRPGTYEVRFDGALGPGVTAKDMILALIAKIGMDGGTQHAFEYTGNAVRALSMEERMTICNMSIEAGARAGLVAPDDKTFEYLQGKPFAPKGAEWDLAVERWKRLPGDPGAMYDRNVSIDVGSLEPFVTYGTNPSMGMGITQRVPDPAGVGDPTQRAVLQKALDYMGLRPGQPMIGQKIDVVFIGSCTNSRIGDLRAAAQVMRGRKVAPGVRALVVPGSQGVKRQAVAEGLDRVFKEAGCEWREPGCSMCIAMNGDEVEPGRYAVSTSNRNFEGRQGKGARTILASPLTAAAAAVTGAIADVRGML